MAALDLDLPVHHGRAEAEIVGARFDVLTARAVGPLWKMLKWFEPHWSSIGRMLLIKGPKWVEERGEARHSGLLANLQLRRVAAYPLGDDSDSEGVILQIWPSGRAGNRFT